MEEVKARFSDKCCTLHTVTIKITPNKVYFENIAMNYKLLKEKDSDLYVGLYIQHIVLSEWVFKNKYKMFMFNSQIREKIKTR